MLDQFSRTRLLLGDPAMLRLSQARVAVFGVGGVGGHVVEALARSGVGAIDVVDDDKVCLTNINRQVIATLSTVGRYKVDVAAERVADINPSCRVTKHRCFFVPQTAGEFDFAAYDYVVDAVDTVTAKLALVMAAREAGAPVISCMGAGNKLNPALFEVADIYETSVDPLARVMRRELRKRGVDKLKVVYSKEPPLTPEADGAEGCRTGCVCPPGTTRHCTDRRSIPGSTAFTPSVAGLIIASEVVKDLIAGAQVFDLPAASLPAGL
jgi:tRNA A37 threonylcarbamoyladenosine dehydratase